MWQLPTAWRHSKINNAIKRLASARWILPPAAASTLIVAVSISDDAVSRPEQRNETSLRYDSESNSKNAKCMSANIVSAFGRVMSALLLHRQ